MRGHLSEGRGWLEGLLAERESTGGRDGGAAVRAKALRGAGGLAVLQGDYERARTLLENSGRLYQELGDTAGRASALNNVAIIAHDRGEHEQATALYEESLALCRELDDTRSIAGTLSNLGEVAYSRASMDAPRRSWRRA